MDCNLEEERPLASRLGSLEDMMKDLLGKFAIIEAKQSHTERSVTVPQPSFVGVHQQPQGVTQGVQQQSYAAAAATGVTLAPSQVK